jgi:hypothetical protein
MIRALLVPLFLSGAAFAQVGGPVLGYVPEGSSVRTMYGLPAAGAIGPLIAEGGWSQVAISPSQNFLLATSADSGAVLLVNVAKSGVTAVSGAGANPSLLAISPTGTSAALWFDSNEQLQIITGLPDAPSVSTINASFLNGSPTALAVSDDGQWTVGVWSAGVYAFGPSAKVLPLQTDAGVMALAFFHNNYNLALATSARATMINGVGAANQSSVLYDYSAQPLSPRGLATSFDNQYAVMADASGKIVNMNVPASGANIVDCGCAPTGVFSLGGSIFRLNGTGGPNRNALERGGTKPDLKVFDAAAGSVWIVPPQLAAAGGRP